MDKTANPERQNLQSFCRTCLQKIELTTTSAPTYSISETPNLMKTIILCTSLSINEDTDALYPKFLCMKCYILLQEFKQFREMAWESNEILRNLIASESSTDVAKDDASQMQDMYTIDVKCENVNKPALEFIEIFKAEDPQLASTFGDEEEFVPCSTSNVAYNEMETESDVNLLASKEWNRNEMVNLEKQKKQKAAEKRPYVKDFVVDVVHSYTDIEFKKHFRMNRENANYLIGKYSNSSSYIKRTYKGGRKEIPTESQILMFLWFCSNKTTIREVSNLFNMSLSSVHKVFNQVLTFMVDDIAREEIRFPLDSATKEEIANQFQSICGFPNVLGCINGSNIAVRTPKHKFESSYVNKHESISLIVQGICDANLRFLDVFTGIPSKISPSRVLELSHIGDELANLCSPHYHLLGAFAYPLRTYLLIPYPEEKTLSESERKYNQKHYQTIMKIENAFQLLKCRFRQLMRKLDFHELETMGKFIIACCALHNICIRTNDIFEEELVDCVERTSNETQIVNQDCIGTPLTEQGEVKRNQIKTFLCEE